MLLNKTQEELISEFVRIEKDIVKIQSKIASLSDIYVETDEDKLLRLIEDYYKKLTNMMYEKNLIVMKFRKTTC